VKFLTAETKLSYADLQHLSLTNRSQQHLQRTVPQWALSKEAIKAVVLAKLKRYTRFIGGNKKREIDKASDLTALETLARKSQRSIRRFDSPQFRSYHVAQHLKSVKTRSLAALWIYEIYAAYRLGRNSVDIALQLGITPWTVRQHLHRLNKVALELFPHLCVPARQYGGPCTRETFLDTKIAEAERRVERASRSKKYCGLVPVYKNKLAELRKMKADREAERQHATLYQNCSVIQGKQRASAAEILARAGNWLFRD
jgi:hypothetical protein